MEMSQDEYLRGLLPEAKNWVSALETHAAEDHIPIMDPVSMQVVMQLLRIKQPTKILEVGTAIGYSALRMLEACPEASVVSIERDKKRYKEAVQNIGDQKQDTQINVMFGDALELEKTISAYGPFDVLFIDAAKGQYQRFFNLYEKMVTSGGLIITDNVLFKGYVADPEKDHPRFTKLANKIRHYNEWLYQQSNYTTTIIPVGDGIALSYKQAEGEYI